MVFRYKKTPNGFKTPQIAVDPEGNERDIFDNRFYQYPNDIEKTKGLLEEVHGNIKHAKACLTNAGFDAAQIKGFIPLYAHRVLVVLKDKTKSPVISVSGNDIVLYGKSLIDYMCKEFGLEQLD